MRRKISISLISIICCLAISGRAKGKSFLQSTEVGLSHCEDCGTSDKVESTSNIKDVIKGLREVAISKPNYVQFDNMVYEALGNGLFLNKNCYESDNSRDTLLEKINQTLEGMVSCLNESSDWLRDQGLLKHANSMDNNILGQLSNHLSGVGGPLKITCTYMIDDTVGSEKQNWEGPAMVAYIPKDLSDAERSYLEKKVSKADEAITDNTISIVSKETLESGKVFSRALDHELIHIITGIRHGETELAYSCSNMCKGTAGNNFFENNQVNENGAAVRRLCGFDHEGGDSPGFEYAQKKGIDAVLNYVQDNRNVFLEAEETNGKMYQSWLMTYWKRNKEELLRSVIGNEEAEDILLQEFVPASKYLNRVKYVNEKNKLINALKTNTSTNYSKPEPKLVEVFQNLMAKDNLDAYFENDIKNNVKSGQEVYDVVNDLEKFLGVSLH